MTPSHGSLGGKERAAYTFLPDAPCLDYKVEGHKT